MAAAAGGGAVTLHLLASLTSLATCLVVLARLGMPYLGSLPVLDGGRAVGAVQLRGAGSSSSWPVSGSSVLPTSLSAEERCLAAASDGAWRRVSNLTRTSPLPPEVAAWHTEDAFTFATESFSYEWAWSASAVAQCGMRRRTPAEIAAAFSQRRLVFLGDSHVLYMHNWLATALGGHALPSNMSGVPMLDLSQTVSARHIQLEMHRRSSVLDINAMLHSWHDAQWPDVLVMGALEYSDMLTRNLTRHLSQMRTLLNTLREKAPSTTFLAWLSPQPTRRVEKSVLPTEWVRLFDNVALDLGLYRPRGPAVHLDLFQFTLECSPWCLAGDNLPVPPVLNGVLVQQLTNAHVVWAAQVAPAAAAAGTAAEGAPDLAANGRRYK